MARDLPMADSSTRLSAQQFLDGLEAELKAHPVHRNAFFQAFQRGVTRPQLRRFVGQWYLFGLKFRKILIGLLYNLSDQDETISLELMRVLHSEFGNGVRDRVHAEQILKLADRLGLDRSVLQRDALYQEAQEYLETIGEIFLHGDLPSALGASFGIETTA
ncbi:MAG: iron-containing redox enzyme family protein, partial [bacterium]